MSIHGNLYNWVKNYLTDRTIQTKVNHGISSKEILEEGLPQGSSLSSTLFLIFINDITKDLKCENALYADDLVLWSTQKKAGTCAILLNEDLKRLEAYCNKWKIKINITKTTYTIFTKSNTVAKEKVSLEIGGHKLEKVDNPVYLGVTLDRHLNFNEHIRLLKEKATKRLKIGKRLASTKWGADKSTLRQLYIGYVRSVLESNLPLQSISSDTTLKSLDQVESQALHFIAGGMRSAPTAACGIDVDIEPLELRREAAVIEMVERYRREDKGHPNRKIVEEWKLDNRIQQNSVLKIEKRLQEKHHLPGSREPLQHYDKNTPPFLELRRPNIRTSLNKEVSKKHSDPVELMVAGLKTVQDYPDEWIKVYTDGSAFKGTMNAGYGVRIEHTDKTTEELYNPCGVLCSNYEAEALAIEAAIHQLQQQFTLSIERKQNVVIFSDSMSVLQALENEKQDSTLLTNITKTISTFMNIFEVEVTLQWIPSHCEIPGNERADTLAKKGAQSEQPNIPVSLATAKQIIKANNKIERLNNWALCGKGRSMFAHMPTPNKKDPNNTLKREDQVTIFRLRTQHIPLNAHLNRIKADHAPTCPLCDHPQETVKHFLFDCEPLNDLRKQYLPPSPDLENTLYADRTQLQQTSKYYTMANRRRMQVHMA